MLFSLQNHKDLIIYFILFSKLWRVGGFAVQYLERCPPEFVHVDYYWGLVPIQIQRGELKLTHLNDSVQMFLDQQSFFIVSRVEAKDVTK